MIRTVLTRGKRCCHWFCAERPVASGLLVLAGVPSGPAEELPDHQGGADRHRGGVHKDSVEEQEVRGACRSAVQSAGLYCRVAFGYKLNKIVQAIQE